MQKINYFDCQHIRKKIIHKAVYDTYDIKFYDDRHVETLKPQFNAFVERCLKQTENSYLFTEWERNLDEFK